MVKFFPMIAALLVVGCGDPTPSSLAEFDIVSDRVQDRIPTRRWDGIRIQAFLVKTTCLTDGPDPTTVSSGSLGNARSVFIRTDGCSYPRIYMRGEAATAAGDTLYFPNPAGEGPGRITFIDEHGDYQAAVTTEINGQLWAVIGTATPPPTGKKWAGGAPDRPGRNDP